jgi:hypothetical protein
VQLRKADFPIAFIPSGIRTENSLSLLFRVHSLNTPFSISKKFAGSGVNFGGAALGSGDGGGAALGSGDGAFGGAALGGDGLFGGAVFGKAAAPPTFVPQTGQNFASGRSFSLQAEQTGSAATTFVPHPGQNFAPGFNSPLQLVHSAIIFS